MNGIRLHYLDWGGNGPTLIFLTGMGSSAYIYGGFAPLFTDQFRVLALTRRGHGDSALQIEKAAFAGHSIAGVELTHFAATHPERVEKLIYLDALDDRRKERVVMEQHPLRNVQIKREESIPPRTLEEYIANVKREVPEFARIWSVVWDEEFAHAVVVNEEGIVVDKMPVSIEKMMVENLIKDYAPKVVKAQIPILSFYGKRKRKLTDDYTEEQKAANEKFHRDVIEPFFKYLVDEFQGRFPQAQIVVIPDGHHYCFMAQEELVHAEMRKFLLA